MLNYWNWVFVIGVVIVAALIFVLWPRIKGWFLDSETILIARLVELWGIVLFILQAVVTSPQVAPILNAFGLGKWTPLFVFVAGLVIEAARKNRTEGGLLGSNLTPKE